MSLVTHERTKEMREMRENGGLGHWRLEGDYAKVK
jgi:hypothetical protein